MKQAKWGKSTGIKCGLNKEAIDNFEILQSKSFHKIPIKHSILSKDKTIQKQTDSYEVSNNPSSNASFHEPYPQISTTRNQKQNNGLGKVMFDYPHTSRQLKAISK